MTIELDPSQRKAVSAALDPRRHLTIITGPAGTGKTTVIRNIADHLNGQCRIMAPTGKAAARITEATGYPAATIHRELMWDGDQVRRKEPFSSPVIIDEASMMDAWLMATLLRFRPPRLILVGDADQLPPVGKGQPFHDLTALGGDRVQTLTVSHRASEAVHQAATAIREGACPPDALDSESETWRFVQTGGAEASMDRLLTWIEAGQYDPAQDIVLSCRYGDEGQDDGGIDALNRSIRQLVNPPLTTAPFQAGDRVLMCKNFGGDDIWNGDTGTVRDQTADGFPVLELDRDPAKWRSLSKEQVRELKHGFALSVHKAQGSQFRRVFFLCLPNHAHMLNRALIYTAVTRARAGAVVLGDKRTFIRGINATSRKRTILQRMMGKAA